ncbi:MAG: hypothetical protein J4N94_03025 [Chloroflexi bacterium]|nr:hypothetical protein [Chloroflexota bacterium]
MSGLHRVTLVLTGEVSMDPYESNTHSFIVKVWLEDDDEQHDRPTWRGHVTHVPSNQRRYVDDLNGISTFISTYLERMGVGVGERWRGLRGWWRRPGTFRH